MEFFNEEELLETVLFLMEEYDFTAEEATDIIFEEDVILEGKTLSDETKKKIAKYAVAGLGTAYAGAKVGATYGSKEPKKEYKTNKRYHKAKRDYYKAKTDRELEYIQRNRKRRDSKPGVDLNEAMSAETKGQIKKAGKTAIYLGSAYAAGRGARKVGDHIVKKVDEKDSAKDEKLRQKLNKQVDKYGRRAVPEEIEKDRQERQAIREAKRKARNERLAAKRAARKLQSESVSLSEAIETNRIKAQAVQDLKDRIKKD